MLLSSPVVPAFCLSRSVDAQSLIASTQPCFIVFPSELCLDRAAYGLRVRGGIRTRGGWIKGALCSLSYAHQKGIPVEPKSL